MANIKISELDELQKATDQDLFVIVDSDKNITKKIQAGNLGILVPKTTKTTSDTETYSCNYVNGIVESGSNENGNWIKYNDGTMICTISKDVSFTNFSQDKEIYYADISNVNFSQTFTEINSISAIFNSTKQGAYPWLGLSNASKSNISRIRLFNYYNTSVTGNIYITVIGKWK